MVRLLESEYMINFRYHLIGAMMKLILEIFLINSCSSYKQSLHSLDHKFFRIAIILIVIDSFCNSAMFPGKI